MSALDGTFVVDLTSLRSGPTCTRILADFGTDPVCVERPAFDRDRVFFDQADLQRNKRNIAVDLQDARGVEILERPAARADVLVGNYRPGVKHRLDLDYETLARGNPRLVYVSVSQFGQDGPYRDRPAYDRSCRAPRLTSTRSPRRA